MSFEFKNFTNKTLNYLNKYKIVFILLFLLFLISRKLFNTGLLWHGDLFYPLNLKDNFLRYISAWDFSNLGIEASTSFNTLTNIILIQILQKIFPNWMNMRILLFLPIFLIGIFTYILASYLFRKSKYKEGAALIASIYSVSNPVIYNYLDSGTYVILFALAFAILAFYFVIKAFQEKKAIYIVYASLATLFLNHLAIVVLFVFFLSIFAIFELVGNFNKENVRTIFKFFSIFAFLVFLLNAYWILPLSRMFFQGSFKKELFASGSDFAWLIDMSNASRLIGASHLRHLPYGFVKDFDSIQIIFSYAILICIFAPLIFYKKNKNILFFSFAGVLFVILSLGVKKPMGILFEFLWKNFAFFHGFRSTIRFLIFPIISFSILIGYFFIYLAHQEYFCSKARRAFLIGILAIMMIFSIWPLFTGDVLGSISPISLPESYYQVKQEIGAKNDNSNILILPDNLSPFFSWSDKPDKLLQGMYFENKFYDNPIIFLFILSFSKEHKFLYSQIQEDADLNKLLPLFNVKHIILHKDYLVNNDFKRPNRNFYYYKDILNRYDAIKLEKEFQEFEYYTVDDKYVLPKIFIPSTLTHIKSEDWLKRIGKSPDDMIKVRSDWQVSVNSGVKMKENDNENYRLISKILNDKRTDMKNLYFLDDLMPEKSAYLLDIIKNKKYSDFEVEYKNEKAEIVQAFSGSDAPSIKFSQIHPTKYRIIVHNAKTGFPLVFSESFHPEWKIYYTKLSGGSNSKIGETWFKNPLSEEGHFLANIYANGWWIDINKVKNYKKNPDGSIDFEMIMEYRPQRLFYLGLLVTFLGFVMVFILIVKFCRPMKEEKYGIKSL